MSKKTVLVTGVSGMLGKVLAKGLAESYDVLGISKSGREGTESLDLADGKAIHTYCASHRPDLVVHAAAYSDVDGCERDSGLARSSNALGTKNLMEALGPSRVPVVYVSTDYVFGGTKNTPYTEADQTFPINIYGLTKLEGEYCVRGYPGPSAIVRTSWLFGPKNPKNFVNAMVERLRQEKRVRVLDDQQNCPTYVADLSEAIMKIMGYLEGIGKKDPMGRVCELFHFCNRGVTTRFEMTLKIKEYLGMTDVRVERCEREMVQERLAVRPRTSAMSAARYENFFKIKIRDWQESLREYLDGLIP